MSLSYGWTVHKHRHRLFTLAFYLLHDRGEAEDIVQETLIRLWQQWDALDHKRILGWLITVTRNQCLDRLRLRSSRKTFARVIGDDIVPQEEIGPGRVHASGELDSALCEALSELGEPQRSLVVLREIQGMGYADIAQALDLSLEQVKVYLFRARRKLREQLADWVTE